jgi:hypothetical protein
MLKEMPAQPPNAESNNSEIRQRLRNDSYPPVMYCVIRRCITRIPRHPSPSHPFSFGPLCPSRLMLVHHRRDQGFLHLTAMLSCIHHRPNPILVSTMILSSYLHPSAGQVLQKEAPGPYQAGEDEE